MDDLNWIRSTKELPFFEINIAFALSRKFYFGDDNSVHELSHREEYSDDLYFPIPDTGELVTVTSINDRVDELISHYESVFDRSRKHKKKISQHYFGVRPFIRSIDDPGVLVSFPWYDSLDEIRYLFAGLTKEEEGVIFFDADQGWELTAAHQNAKIYIQQIDPDDGEIFSSINVDRGTLLKQMEDRLVKADLLVKKLADHFKTDYWSRYLYGL